MGFVWGGRGTSGDYTTMFFIYYTFYIGTVPQINWWKQKFEAVSFIWIGRDRNKVADCLAKHRLSNNMLFVSHFYVPNFITHLLHSDQIRSLS
ncbi:hypothetical protein BRARA_H02873 [Brassica rapa]|uniref:RNase H type-1 domain-containing protein n=1 Tax=Brassica campestris TaxID=3711 RepID=A0A397YMJ3_BRACM|nr:hypothetical protein BRARA_H02873 [Brassica rapa]